MRGNPGYPYALGYRVGVYPRVCGGTETLIVGIRINNGLSPRVRGNQTKASGPDVVKRSIPACAGEPGWPVRRHCWTPVYPRVCGGTDNSSVRVTGCHGLSPRVRGNLHQCRALHSFYRSIPACAGEPIAN